ARAALEPYAHPATRSGRMLEWGLIIAWLLVTLALCAALPLLPAILEHRTDVLALLLGVAALLLIHAAFRGYRAGRKRQALVSVIAACVVLYGTSYDRVMPQLDRLWISTRVAQAVARAKPCAQAVVTSAGFSEPSLVFL